MPDNDRPAAKSETEAPSGEFDFTLPVDENPRVKKRSLRPRTENKLQPQEEAAPARSALEREAPSRQAETAPVHDAESEEPARPAASTQPHFASTARPGGTPAPTPSSAHGTRPATLYYSTGASKDKPKEKEPAPPMKTTTSTAPSTASAPSSPSSTVRPASVIDYRTNMERQAREQKSMGNLLAIVVYVLIGFFVLSSFLAGYGIFALSKQIKKQSLTIDELDKHYAAENQKLNTQLQSTLDTLTQAQAQIGRQQALILQEQEAINRLSAANDANAAALRQERTARADENSDLRERLRNLEYHGGPTTQRY